jgi:ribosomal protein L37E
VTATLVKDTLTAADRCDRCGAQAYLRVRLNSGGELLFCAHHGREHSGKLREVAADITDESAKLSQVSGTASADER